MKTISVAGLGVGLVMLVTCSLVSANIVEIDFNGLTAGEVVTSQYASEGVTFSLLGTPVGYGVDGPVAASISSTTYPSASGIALTPGNNASDPFYDVELLFSTSIDYFSLLSLDSDEALNIFAFQGSTQVQMQSYPAGTDTQVWNLELGGIGGGVLFDRVVLDVVEGAAGTMAGGPEYFDNLKFNSSEVPEPATFMLFGAALAGLLGTRGRRK